MFRVIVILAFAAIALSLTQSASVDSSSKDEKGKSLNEEPESSEELSMDTLRQVMMKCNESFTIDMYYIQSLNESGSFPDEYQRTPKCYVRCLLENIGIATKDGVYDPSRMSMVLEIIKTNQEDKSSFKKIAEGCNDKKETCKCERAYQYVKCVFETEIKKNSR